MFSYKFSGKDVQPPAMKTAEERTQSPSRLRGQARLESIESSLKTRVEEPVIRTAHQRQQTPTGAQIIRPFPVRGSCKYLVLRSP